MTTKRSVLIVCSWSSLHTRSFYDVFRGSDSRGVLHLGFLDSRRKVKSEGDSSIHNIGASWSLPRNKLYKYVLQTISQNSCNAAPVSRCSPLHVAGSELDGQSLMLAAFPPD